MYTFSLEHKSYLKRIRREKIFITTFRIMIILIFFILWELLSRWNIINTFLFSSPSKIINTIVLLFRDGSLFKHIGITIYEVIIRLIISRNPL